jgi:sugar phosphate isomerase/epimerase
MRPAPAPRLDRRAFLAALAAAPAAALATTRRPVAPPISLGIMSSVYGELPVAEAARRMRADGFSCVICDYAFADARFDPLAPGWDAVRKVRGALEANGLRIVSLFGYHNLMDPDEARRKQGAARFEAMLRHATRLGCPLVATETGTLNAQSEWLEWPENDTEAAFVRCRDTLKAYARLAERHGAQVGIEPYWRNIVGSVERTERLFREVDSPALVLVMDPCNYYRAEDLPRMRPLLDRMFAALGDRVAVAHAKDVKASESGTDLPAAGLGVLDYPAYLAHLARLGRPVDLVLEHLKLADVPRARDFVRSHLAGLAS